MAYGIDIGSSAVKVALLRRALRGYRLLFALRRRVPRVAPAERGNAIRKILREALGGRGGPRAGVVGLSGRDINLQMVQQPAMKPLNYRVMMNYELDQRKGGATDLYLDYCTLREPDPYFPQYLALVGIGRSAYVDERLDILAQAEVDARDAVPNAFALYAVHRNAYGAEGGTVVLLDVGSDNMDVAFVRGGRLIFARNVSSGARAFDASVAGMTKVSPEDAEILKIAYGNLGPSGAGEEDEGVRSRVRAAVRAAAGQLSGFVTASINHARMQLNDRELEIDKVYLSGGGARLRGLPEYLGGALKKPVEMLDPFRKTDVSSFEGAAAEDLRLLPTDMAVAIGLAQISSDAGATVLSILPDRIRRKRNFRRTTLWLGAAGAVFLFMILALTGMAMARKASEQAGLNEFKAKTAQIRARLNEMEKLEAGQRGASAKADFLLSHTAASRGAMDAVANLRKVLPPGITIREIRLGDSLGRRDERMHRPDTGDQPRVAFLFQGKGLVIGDLESEAEGQLKLKGHPDPYPESGIEGGVVRWPSAARVLHLAGEVDENIRGGPRGALDAVTEGLTDPARGVRARIERQRASDKPGRRAFEIVVDFETPGG